MRIWEWLKRVFTPRCEHNWKLRICTRYHLYERCIECGQRWRRRPPPIEKWE